MCGNFLLVKLCGRKVRKCLSPLPTKNKKLEYLACIIHLYRNNSFYNID